MTENAKMSLSTREALLDLLSDAEVANVSSAEDTALIEGDEYIDLRNPGAGVMQAHEEARIGPAQVLARSAVSEETWSKVRGVVAGPERTLRRIRKVVKGRATLEGAGVLLHRTIGLGPPEEYDPFLLLDDFRSDTPSDYKAGFPWHPHRGMETITYVLRGAVEHRDSLGNTGVIEAGDLQWMSAGSGIVHQEMPKGDERGSMHGFQLWANLPAANKMSEPRYRGIDSADVPVVVDAASGATVRVIAGTVDGVAGPVRDVVTAPEYLDVTVPGGATFFRATPRGHTVFAYIIGGRCIFRHQDKPFAYEEDLTEASVEAQGEALFGDRHLVIFHDGDAIEVSAGEEPLRFLLVSGKPIGEPIAWRGPIVMNTEDELRTAFEELERNTFIKHARAVR